MRYFRTSFAALFLIFSMILGGDAPFRGVLLKEAKPAPSPTVETEQKQSPYDYDLSEYMTMGDITAVQAEFDDPAVCTEKEVDAAVFQVLLSQADFEEKPLNQKAELYNRVTVDLAVMQNQTVLSEYSRIDYTVVIGLETENGEDPVLGEALLGATVGESRSAAYTYPEVLGGEGLSGQSVVLYATVKKIEKQLIPELIDATVGEISGDTFATVQEFREAIRQDIYAQKELAKIQAVWLAIKRDAHVRRFPEKELQEHIASYQSYYETLAAQYELTLEQLVTTYMGQTMEEFTASAREYAEEMTTNDMIFTQLIRLQNMTLTDEEYLAGAREYFEKDEAGFSTFEEFVEYYTEEGLRRELLKDKALKTVVDGAVRIGG